MCGILVVKTIEDWTRVRLPPHPELNLLYHYSDSRCFDDFELIAKIPALGNSHLLGFHDGVLRGLAIASLTPDPPFTSSSPIRERDCPRSMVEQSGWGMTCNHTLLHFIPIKGIIREKPQMVFLQG